VGWRKGTSDHHVIEDAVMASEIEQLPDLVGFLNVASRPEWRRATILRSERDRAVLGVHSH